MRVFVLRNAEAYSNAGIFRIIDALIDMGIDPITVTRSRFNKGKKGKFIYKTFEYKNYSIPNYELQFKTELGRGMKSIFQLVLYQLFTLIWLLKNAKKVDAFHAFDLDAGLPALICSKLTKKKFIYHIADFYIDSRQGIPKKVQKIVKKLEYFIISKADVTIVCTEERKKQIEGSNPKKLYVVHNSPVEQFQSKQTISNEKKTKEDQTSLLTLGYVGGLSDKRFINEIIRFSKSNRQVTLKIAGFGRLEESIKKAATNYTNIQYHGRINYDTALNLYAQCDVMFAMYDPKIPNHKYSAPNKVYEAMMLGLPIIVAKGTGVDSLVKTERIGFSIDYSEAEFSHTINYLINNKEVLEQFKSNSREAYRDYSWTVMKKRVEGIYNQL